MSVGKPRRSIEYLVAYYAGNERYTPGSAVRQLADAVRILGGQLAALEAENKRLRESLEKTAGRLRFYVECIYDGLPSETDEERVTKKIVKDADTALEAK